LDTVNVPADIRIRTLRQGTTVAILSFGSGLEEVLKAAAALRALGRDEQIVLPKRA
jgi:transketolase C-terminal domain/subunit